MRYCSYTQEGIFMISTSKRNTIKFFKSFIQMKHRLIWLSSLIGLFLILLFLFIFIRFSIHPNNVENVEKKEVYTNIKQVPNAGRILWFDLMANIEILNNPKKVQNIIDKTAKANIDTIVLDVKNSNGYVGYLSNIASHLSNSKYTSYPEGYDLLDEVIKAAHSKGIKVHASVNVFSEGNNIYKEGPAFTESEWQSVFYTASRVVEAENGSRYLLKETTQRHGQNELIMYTSSNYVKTDNLKVAEVLIGNGFVTKIIDHSISSPSIEVLENGRVLSGHGKARTWLLENMKVGQKVDLSKSVPKFVKASNYQASTTFVNPIRKDVQIYELSIIKEIIDNYNVDGIVLDKARYSNIYADFSKLSKETFEGYIAKPIKNWPSDIFEITFSNGEKQIKKGPLYKKWIEWRASNIQHFFQTVEKLVHQKDKSLFFSTYVGSWYPEYYNEGVNWASKTFKPKYDWASPTYHKTGYAELLDFLMTGNYYKEVTKNEATTLGNPGWASVEGSAEVAMEAVNSVTPVHGSLYLIHYKDKPEQFRKALQVLSNKTDGIMLFDLYYIEHFGWWSILEEEFAETTE